MADEKYEKERKPQPNYPTKEEQAMLFSSQGLGYYYYKIYSLLGTYMDMNEDDKMLVSIWIIGTYFHKQFNSFPYLFANAMKGSGKTRLLKIIANLAKNGGILGSMTEAVMFRTAYGRTLCIDEIENIGAKGQESLGLLLNAAYKKGTDIERMTKKKTLDGEQQIVEKFKVYCPIAMANIKGMENVLGDRCITIILEKSENQKVTKLIENFENEPEFQEIRGGLMRLTEHFGDDANYFGTVFSLWNGYQNKRLEGYAYDNTQFKDLFDKIENTNIAGRYLELFFPMFIISDICSKDVLSELLKFAGNVVNEKMKVDREDNIDVKIYEFIAQYQIHDYVPIAVVLNDFKRFTDLENEPWLNTRFIGRGLRRLNLVSAEKRTSKRMIALNIKKAQEKYKMFSGLDAKDDNDAKTQEDNTTQVNQEDNKEYILSSNSNSGDAQSKLSSMSNTTITTKTSTFTDKEIEEAGYTREYLEKIERGEN